MTIFYGQGAMFENLHCWLNGVFICRKCDREFHVTWLGYGEAICPDCYNGEASFIFYDNSFWLNRILTRLSSTRTPQPNTIIHEPIDMDQIDSIPAVEIVKKLANLENIETGEKMHVRV